MGLLQSDPFAWVDKKRLEGYSDEELISYAQGRGMNISEAIRAPQVGSDRHTSQMLAGGAARPDDVYGDLDKGVAFKTPPLAGFPQVEFGVGEENVRGAEAIGNAMYGGITREIPSWFSYMAEQAAVPSYARSEGEWEDDGSGRGAIGKWLNSEPPLKKFFDNPPSEAMHESGMKFLDRAQELQPGKEGRLEALYYVSSALDAVAATKIHRVLDFSELGNAWDSVGSAMYEVGAERASWTVDKLAKEAATEASKNQRIRSILRAIDEADTSLYPEKAVQDAIDGVLYKDGVPDYGISDAVADGVRNQLTAVDDAMKLSVVDESMSRFLSVVKRQADDLMKRAGVPDETYKGLRDAREELIVPPPESMSAAERIMERGRKFWFKEEGAEKATWRGARRSIRRNWLDSQMALMDWASKLPGGMGRTALALVKRGRGRAGIMDALEKQGTFHQAEGGEFLDKLGFQVFNEAEAASVAQRGMTILNGKSLKEVRKMAADIGVKIGNTEDEVIRDTLSLVMPAQRNKFDFRMRRDASNKAQIERGENLRAYTALNDKKRQGKILANDYEREARKLDKDRKLLEETIQRNIPEDPKMDVHLEEVLEASKYRYGEHFHLVEELAQEFRDLADRQILQPYLRQGLLTRQDYLRIKEANPYWIPFNKQMQELIPHADDVSLPKSFQKGITKGGFTRIGMGANEYTIDPAVSYMERLKVATAFREEQFLVREVVNLAHEANVAALKEGAPRSRLITLIDEKPVKDIFEDAADGFDNISLNEAQLTRNQAAAGGLQPGGDQLRYYTTNAKGQSVIQYWGGNSELVRAVLDSDQAAMRMVADGFTRKLGLQASARYQRIGFTTNAAFMARNIIRDPQTLNIFAKYTSIPFYNTFEGLIHQAFLTDLWKDYVRNGFGGANLLAQNTGDAGSVVRNMGKTAENPFNVFPGIKGIFSEEMARAAEAGGGTLRNTAHGSWGAAKGALHGLKEWGSGLENATRVGHLAHLRRIQKRGYGKRYLGAIEEAYSDMRKLHKAKHRSVTERMEILGKSYGKHKSEVPDYLDALTDVREGIIDFNRMGAMGSIYNSIEPFFNANLQDAAIFANVARERPLATAIKTANGITLPSVLLWMKNHDDPDYQTLPDYEKDLYWHLMKKGDSGEFYKVPKPFLPGVLWGSMVERFLTYAYDKDPDGVKAGLKTLVDVSPLSYVPAAPAAITALTGGSSQDVKQESVGQFLRIQPGYVQPLAETLMNFSEFKGRSIVPEHLEGAEGMEVYNAKTPMIYRDIANLGNKMTRGSWSPNPTMMQYMVEQTTGMIGEGAVNVLDSVAYNKEKPFKDEWYREWLGFRGLSSAFISRPGIGMGSAPVHKFYTTKKVLDNLATSGGLKKNRGDSDYFEWKMKNSRKLTAAKRYRKASIYLGKLFDQREKMLQGDRLTNAEKQKKRREIDKQITSYAQRTLESTSWMFEED